MSIRINPIDFYPVFLYGFNNDGGGIIPAASLGCVVWNGAPGGNTDGLRASAVGFMAGPESIGPTVAERSGAGPF